MSRYRWNRPLRCTESMHFFPSMKGKSLACIDELLFKAVSCGDIRAMLNDEIVPKAHIGIYLALYARTTPHQELHTLPPDLQINLDDMSAVFDRPNVDNRKRGRPTKENSGGWSEDHKLAFEMHKMLASHDANRPGSATEAARILVKAGRVSGAGTEDSLIARLRTEFRKRYSS
jgi:hypothetical protein